MPPDPQVLILASTSRYRHELLQRLGIPFRCEKPDCDETPMPDEPPQQLAQRLAAAKATSVAERFPESWVIGSDQAAAVGNTHLGKPGDYQRAQTQLSLLSGQAVTFYTGLCLMHAATGRHRSGVVPFTVRMRSLNAEEIHDYLVHEQPYDCAGSFKSEGLGISLFAGMEGEDPTALVGLPLIRLSQWLREAGFSIPPRGSTHVRDARSHHERP